MHNRSIGSRVAVILVFTGMVLFFFAKMAFSNLILARGDTFLYFYPYWQAATDALHHGRVPLWNPHLFMGSPLLANSQMGFFYPLNWPLWLLLGVPYAMKASILLHVALAGLGCYAAARTCWQLGRPAALVAAGLFALGGYVTAQVEHINQLQGIAWLPYYFVVMGWLAQSPRPLAFKQMVATAAFAALFALQLLAGHSQTAFISGVMVGSWLLLETGRVVVVPSAERRLVQLRWVSLLLGGVLALLITAVQLWPTAELMQQSSRQGGLSVNEVLSFSLHPLLLPRALLPAYGQPLFTEYSAFVPVTAVVLALIGAWQWRRQTAVWPLLLWVGLGLFLALGLFNPANWLLARLPLFDLFRVPARWLLMYQLGLALLAGVGWQTLSDGARRRISVIQSLRIAIIGMITIVGWQLAAVYLQRWLPTGPEAPFEAIRPLTLLSWGGELGLALGCGWMLASKRPTWPRPWLQLLLVLLLVGPMWWGSRTQPYNNLTTPEAYFDLRPPMARLLQTQPTTGRFLSLSNIFFDVGDQPEIDSIYADQLPAAARYDYTVAIKHKEVIGPNLPMVVGLTAVDGFDGGILPLRSYTQLMRLLLPDGQETTDGRLREQLTAVPEARWLDLFHARFLITDKTGDVWQQVGQPPVSLYFDRQHPLQLAAGERSTIMPMRSFAFSALLLLADEATGTVLAETGDGQTWPLLLETAVDGLVWARWPEGVGPQAAQQITLQAGVADWRIQGATLLHEADGIFAALTLGGYQQIYSGDVKIYENIDVLPQAFMVYDWQWQATVEAVIGQMELADFQPSETAVLLGNGPLPATLPPISPDNQLQVQRPSAEQFVMQVETQADGLLLLTEAYYPGWSVLLDGRPVPIYQADGYFQAVFVPAGTHELVWTFVPTGWVYGRWLSVVGIGLWLLLLLCGWRLRISSR